MRALDQLAEQTKGATISTTEKYLLELRQEIRTLGNLVAVLERRISELEGDPKA